MKPSDYNKLYMAMQYENALALRVSVETGLRIGDILALRPENIEGSTISCVAQKTGKECKRAISADLKKRLLQISGERYVFEGRYKNEPRSRTTVWKDIKKASKVLGLEVNVGCHSARKTYAVELFREKGLTAVQKELQHDRLETTMLYAFSNLLKAEIPKGETMSDISDIGVDQELAEQVAQRVLDKLLPLLADKGMLQGEAIRTYVPIDNKIETD